MSKISVIVPVYQVEPYLRRCVDSILAQTYRDFELILVDDGSPDRCGEICEEYAKHDARIAVIHRENGGLSAARNSGIDWAFANSTSEYLAFIDSDDWVDASYLRELYNGVCLGCGIAAVAAFRSVNQRDDGVNMGWQKVDPSAYWAESTYKNSAWGKLFRRDLFKTVRFPEGKIYEDAYVIYKVVFSLTAIAYCAKPLYWYFQRSDSILGDRWKPSRLQGLVPLREQLEFFGNRGWSKAERVVAIELANALSLAVVGLGSDGMAEEANALKTELCELLRNHRLSFADYPNLWLAIAPVRARAMKMLMRIKLAIRRRGFLGALGRLLSAADEVKK